MKFGTNLTIDLCCVHVGYNIKPYMYVKAGISVFLRILNIIFQVIMDLMSSVITRYERSIPEQHSSVAL